MIDKLAHSLLRLGRGNSTGDAHRVAPAIHLGQDPLGEHFIRSVSSKERRGQGATFTPQWVVDLQLSRLEKKCPRPARVLDAGAGSGRYAIAAARRWPKARIIAVEKDPALASAIALTAKIAGVRVEVICGSYLELELPRTKGTTMFVGNPPYVRHHDLMPKEKAWYTRVLAQMDLPGNKLAGLHVYFFLKSFLLAQWGDIGSFITSAEWFDNGYGTDMRALFDRMGGERLIRADPQEQVFDDALTTSVITEWTIGSNPAVEFSDLIDQTVHSRFSIERRRLLASDKWPGFGRPFMEPSDELDRLGSYFKISRGQVTGCNEAFIATKETAALIPTRYLCPCITDAKELIRANGVLHSTSELKRVINLPRDLTELSRAERSKAELFLELATSLGAAKSYTAKHRTPWWHLNLKPAPPIMMTYMARRPPVFVRNACGARLLNIAHSVTPLLSMPVAQQNRWIEWLNLNVGRHRGRTYGGGLIKFEPREAERIPVPRGGIA